MKDEYTYAFYKILRSTQTEYSYTIPSDVEAYMVMLLGSFVERVDVPRDEAFAISYMKLDTKDGTYAKELGDDCLFVASMFPEYMTYRGMSEDYVCQIGSGSYNLAAQKMRNTVFDVMSKQFNMCRDILAKTSVSPVINLLNR